jgi:hypothetical protein
VWLLTEYEDTSNISEKDGERHQWRLPQKRDVDVNSQLITKNVMVKDWSNAGASARKLSIETQSP